MEQKKKFSEDLQSFLQSLNHFSSLGSLLMIMFTDSLEREPSLQQNFDLAWMTMFKDSHDFSTLKTVVKRIFLTWPSDSFVTLHVSDVQNCGKMQILDVTEQPVPSVRTLMTILAVIGHQKSGYALDCLRT